MATPLDWRSSVDFLALLDPQERAALMATARRTTHRAGTRAEYPTSQLEAQVIESGLVRAYQVAADGREATIGYLYGGQYAGALPAVGPLPAVHLQAVIDTKVLHFHSSLFDRLVETDLTVSRALAVHTATVLIRIVRVVTVRTLGSVLERVAFDLLERLTDEQLIAGELVLNVTHDEIANSVGSVRGVVTRALGELREAGILLTSHGRVRVDDVVRLTRVVQGLVV